MTSTPERRWTAAIESLVVGTLVLPHCADPTCYTNDLRPARQKAQTILGILADAGLLVEPDNDHDRRSATPDYIEIDFMGDQSTWPAHLRDDAPYQKCSYCDRKTWSTEDFGRRCGMTLPHRGPCTGMFGPVAR